MNEKMDYGQSIFQAGMTDPASIIASVTERMLVTRPRYKMVLRPFMEQPIKQNTALGPYATDFNLCWPDAVKGSIAYAAARFYAMREQNVIITVSGSTKLWFNGLIHTEKQTISLKMKQGWNELLLKCIKTPTRWGFDLTIAFPRYPSMWAKDYLFSTRPTFPQPALHGEEGFAYKPA
ncbi:hypothetical protein EBB07_22740 [Paenibacillaceae bacterium]|nr:hypothetical protein EBB07_22740 [Paenibacillaceae bacterium]